MSINSQELKSAISAVKTAIGTRGDIPALKSVLVKDNTLTAYNLETGIIATIDGHTDEPFLLPPKAIDLIPKLPDDDVKIEVGKVITLECGAICTDFPVEDIDTFPEVKAGGDLSEPIQIDGEWFRWAVKATAYAVAKVDTKPVQQGVLLDCKHGHLNVVACDGYRVVWAKKECAGEWQVNVYPEALRPLLSMSEDVFVRHSRRRAIFECGDISVIARPIEGDFMSYENSIPSNPHSMTVNQEQFVSALSRINLLYDTKKLPTTVVEANNGSMEISINQSTVNYGEEIPAVHDEYLRIGFNHRYLKECLESFSSESVKIQHGGALSPVVITGEEDAGLLAMVLPVRIRDEEKI